MTESDQIERAVAGDAVALRALLERHGSQVWNEIRSQIGAAWQSAIDADDVMQVTYIEAYLAVGTLTSRDAGGFLAWLRRLAQNNLRDAVRELDRKKRPSPARQLPAPNSDESCQALIELLGAESTTPSREARRGEARRVLHDALEQLPPDYAAVVRLYDLEGKPVDAVAAELRRSTGAVHMLRARAHDRLRAILGDPGRFFSEA